MDSNVIGTNNTPNDASQESSGVGRSNPDSGNRADYSQPELLIRTFQGQLDAMMVEHERCVNSCLHSPARCRHGRFSHNRPSL